MKTLNQNSNAGLGILEVIIASGILAILVLGFLTVLNTANNGAQSVQKRLDANQLQSFISNIFNNATICTNTLSGQPAPVAVPPDSVSVPTLTFAGMNFDDTTNSAFDNGQVKIASLKYHSVTNLGGTYAVVVRLQVSAQGTGTQTVVGGGLLAPVDLPLVVNVAGGVITGCATNTAINPVMSPYFGGTSSTATWNVICPSGYGFSGANVRDSAYLDHIKPHCMPASGTGNMYLGGDVGGTGGGANTFDCPAGSFISTVNGRSSVYVDQISFTCTDSTGTVTATSPGYGGGGGSPYTFSCPAGDMITELRGYNGAYVDGISFVCNPR